MDFEFAFATATAAEPVLPGLWGLTPIAGMLGMIVLLYWLLATGRMITRAQHDREIKFRDGIIEKQDATIVHQANQLTKLLSVGTTVKAVLREASPGNLYEDTGNPLGDES